MAIVLVLHDRPDISASIAGLLRGEGHVVHEARDGCGAERVLSHAQVDVVVDAGGAGACPGLSGIPRVRADAARLVAAVREAIRESSGADGDPHGQTERVIAVDPVTRKMFERAAQIASVDTAVLIMGESGTGKEVVARAIHRHSRRSARPFVPVNCGALPDSLIESELFGHRKGAFTGAILDKRGLVDEAHGGTLFLDELGEMSPSMQVRLLRFLDGGEVRRVGDTTLRWVDVRVVAATNRDLNAEVESGRFRHDLFYRIAAISLQVPALRERPRDIPMLVEQTLRDVSARLGKDVRGMSEEAWALLRAYAWPGNVRELQSVVQSALVLSTGEFITADDLPARMQLRCGPCGALPSPPEQDRDRLLAVLKEYRGNRQRAAAALGISRTTLWRRLRNGTH
jgi:DNA-binding NtrC family response regulator